MGESFEVLCRFSGSCSDIPFPLPKGLGSSDPSIIMMTRKTMDQNLRKLIPVLFLFFLPSGLKAGHSSGSLVFFPQEAGIIRLLEQAAGRFV